MENIMSFSLLGIALLVIGLFVGSTIFATHTVEKVNVPGQVVEKTVYVNQTVEVPTEVKLNVEDTYLTPAFEDLFDEYDRNSDWLTVDGYEFDKNQVDIGTVYEWSYTFLDDDMYEISGEFKIEGVDNSDNRANKERRTFSVIYEDGEKNVYSWDRS